MKRISVVCGLVLVGFTSSAQQKVDGGKKITIVLTVEQANNLYYVVDHSTLPHNEVEEVKTFLQELFKRALSEPVKIDSTISKPPAKK